MTEELKPCPFCGSGAVLFERGTAKAVRCSNTKCGARMIAYQDNYDPIVAWNRRADRDAVLQEAAQIAHGMGYEDTAERIRALKEKPNDQ